MTIQGDYDNENQVSADTAHIFSVNLDTNETEQLTVGEHRNLQPAWSPDGNRIAFISNRDGNFELYVMNSDGSGVNRLTSSVEDESHPTWSPDGTQIAFDRTRELPNWKKEIHLYTVSLIDRTVGQLTHGLNIDYHPAWSPDGRYLAFNRDIANLEGDQQYYQPFIYLLDVTNGTEIPLAEALVNEVSFPTASGWEQVWLNDPVWLPSSDHTYLSLTQLPARCSEGGVIAVFELDWSTSLPKLEKITEISGGADGYTWGPNGTWVISSEYNGQDANVPRSQPDLSARFIGVRSPVLQSATLDLHPVHQQAPCLELEEVVWLTNTASFEVSPDWKP